MQILGFDAIIQDEEFEAASDEIKGGFVMRSEEQMRKRLKEAVEARRQLMEEEQSAEKKHDNQEAQELAEEIANLGGVITTLEWVLETGAAPEYE